MTNLNEGISDKIQGILSKIKSIGQKPPSEDLARSALRDYLLGLFQSHQHAGKMDDAERFLNWSANLDWSKAKPLLADSLEGYLEGEHDIRDFLKTASKDLYASGKSEELLVSDSDWLSLGSTTNEGYGLNEAALLFRLRLGGPGHRRIYEVLTREVTPDNPEVRLIEGQDYADEFLGRTFGLDQRTEQQAEEIICSELAERAAILQRRLLDVPDLDSITAKTSRTKDGFDLLSAKANLFIEVCSDFDDWKPWLGAHIYPWLSGETSDAEMIDNIVSSLERTLLS